MDLLKDRKWSRRWNPKLDVLGNLQAAFGETLRFLPKGESVECSVACAICYAYLLGDQTPKVREPPRFTHDFAVGKEGICRTRSL